jgi:hypothetical protein
MPRGRRGRGWRRLWIVLGALAVLAPVLFFAAYAVVAKKLLTGPSLRAEINRKPVELRIDWDVAQSTWPGYVEVKNLRIRGSDPNVQWIVILPEANFRYSLLPLLRRHFVVTKLRPKSIQFRIRQKLPPGRFPESRIRYLPPIEGFGEVPLKMEGETLPKPESNPFTVEVQDVATDVFDDIWFDGFRYRGPAKLRGRFRLRPGYRARIGPAAVEFEGGALAVDETPAVTKLSGRLDATFAEWDVQELKENKIWRVVTAKAALAGPTHGVDFLDGLLQLGSRVHVSGGPGRFALSGEIDRGKASGKVEVTARKGKYVRPGLSLVGNAEARLAFSNWVLDGGSPEIGGSALEISDVFVAGAAEGTKAWWGKFGVPDGRLAKGGVSGKVALKCSDGRPLLAFLGEALPKWTRGLIDLEGLTATAGVVLSEPRTTVRNLQASGEKFSVEGDYDRRGETSHGAFYIESGILRVAVQLENGKPILRPFGARKWFEEHRGLGGGSER